MNAAITREVRPLEAASAMRLMLWEKGNASRFETHKLTVSESTRVKRCPRLKSDERKTGRWVFTLLVWCGSSSERLHLNT